MKKPVVLVILDGWGVNNHLEQVNGIRIANPKNFMRYKEEYPYTELRADGEYVGLPEGQFGNSEVGHLNIGAGRVVYQLLPKISKEIREGKILKNEVLVNVMNYTKTNNKKLHIIGLVDMAKKNGIEKVYIHAITDGRDTSTTGGVKYLEETNKELEKIGLRKNSNSCR